MPAEEPENHPQSKPTLDRVRDFLESLPTAGPAGLDHQGQAGIRKVTLRKVDLVCNTPLHYRISISSDDLLNELRALDPALDPFNCGGTISGATLEFAFEDSDLPHLVHIHKSNPTEFQFQQDAERVFGWMDERRARLAQKIAKTATILLLALAATIAPALDDGDNDDDDTDNDRHAHLSYLVFSS